MKKLAIGLVALAILAGSMASPAAAQDPWGWVYFSTADKSYNCNDSGTPWDSGQKTFYIVVEAPDWGFGDAFNAFEFGLDYPAALFFVGIASPEAPAPLFIGSCAAGHCSYGMGTGGQTLVESGIWTAIAIDFLNFGAGNNLGFSLAPSDNPSPRADGGPAWAYFDANDPPIYIPQAGDGTPGHPGWQQGFVVMNYDQASAPATPFPETVFRGGTVDWPLFNAGDPCLRDKIVSSDESSWGALKAGY